MNNKDKPQANLYLVESPLQLLGAIEAKQILPADRHILIMRKTLSDNSNRQMDVMVTMTTWSEVIIVKPFYKMVDADLQLICRLCRLRRQNFSHVLVGEYRSWVHRLFCKNLENSRPVLLDDGTATIYIQNNLISKGLEYNDSGKIKKALLRMTAFFCGLQWKTRVVPDLFTCFDLQTMAGQSLVRNEFDFLRSQLVDRPRADDVVFFFGAPLSDEQSSVNDIVSRSDELEMLKKIHQYYQLRCKRLVYIPHRREDEDKISAVSNTLDVEIQHFSLPAEIELANLPSLPWGIASFYSTALFTLSHMYMFPSVEAFRIRGEKIKNGFRESTESIYTEYAKNFPVIDTDGIA